MRALSTKLTKNVSLIVFGALLSLSNPLWAESSDKAAVEEALKQREMSPRGGMDHSAHEEGSAESAGKYRGVFYGYLPCQEKECSGIKMTLSLKHNNTYLLIVQPAKPYNRETFEKGRYTWDDGTATVMLTPTNKAYPVRRLTIKDEATLVVVNGDGSAMPGSQDDYVLARSDKAGNREMHIH